MVLELSTFNSWILRFNHGNGGMKRLTWSVRNCITKGSGEPKGDVFVWIYMENWNFIHFFLHHKKKRLLIPSFCCPISFKLHSCAATKFLFNEFEFSSNCSIWSLRIKKSEHLVCVKVRFGVVDLFEMGQQNELIGPSILSLFMCHKLQ